MKQRKILILLIIFWGFYGCGGGEKSQNQEKSQVVVPEGTASISGEVKYVGEPPSPRQLNLVRECSVLHDKPVYAQNVVINENGTLKWVFVYVKEGIDKAYSPPNQPMELDQKGCIYHPHVLGIQVGQTLRILNSDPLLHNIHAIPKINRSFNFSQPGKGNVREIKFDKSEIMIPVKCDVHPWMKGYIGVLSHPYYSVTGEDGKFSIKKLPAGEYVVEAWHEELGTQTLTVTLTDGESKSIEFTFGPRGEAASQ
ncbi:MAG: hypothetical protein D6813_01040 [Calditrichaeota bacterium]|nr:MAG: hypothetical protein D6813_01040 [Calditrichota bacterium]